MAEAISKFGTATVSSTSASPGNQPYVTITSTGNFTATNGVFITAMNRVADSYGTSVTLSWSRVDDDNIYVKADRQLPAGTSIGFWWLSTSQ